MTLQNLASIDLGSLTKQQLKSYAKIVHESTPRFQAGVSYTTSRGSQWTKQALNKRLVAA